jgi:hypothetical protein
MKRTWWWAGGGTVVLGALAYLVYRQSLAFEVVVFQGVKCAGDPAIPCRGRGGWNYNVIGRSHHATTDDAIAAAAAAAGAQASLAVIVDKRTRVPVFVYAGGGLIPSSEPLKALEQAGVRF